MNTRIYTLSASIIILLVSGILGYLFLTNPKSSIPDTSHPGLPVSGSVPSGSGTFNNQTETIPTSDGGNLSVNDILKDPETIADPVNQGYYYLGYHPAFDANSTQTNSVPYMIEYISNTNYFNIELLQEPIGTTRLLAQAYLLQHLGIPQNDLCSLKYMVSVPASVNEYYASQNLGFSFCPRAVTLPQ